MFLNKVVRKNTKILKEFTYKADLRRLIMKELQNKVDFYMEKLEKNIIK